MNVSSVSTHARQDSVPVHRGAEGRYGAWDVCEETPQHTRRGADGPRPRAAQ